MEQETVKKVKRILSNVGAFASAISGLSIGLLSIFRVFYPDPPTTSSSTTITNTNQSQPETKK